MIEPAYFHSPIGFLSILALEEGIVKISFSTESMEELEKWCMNHGVMEAIGGINLATEAKIIRFPYRTSEFTLSQDSSKSRKKNPLWRNTILRRGSTDGR